MQSHELFNYKGYAIPTHLVEITGGGPATFDVISVNHMAALARYMGIVATHDVLEIGCGIGRDAIPLTQIVTRGTYLGIDIIDQSIAWCRNNITPAHPHFRFHHFDIKDQLHNPNGSTGTRAVKLPLA